MTHADAITIQGTIPRWMARPVRLLVLVPVLLLSGCFDVDVELTFTRDEQVQLRSEVRMPKSLFLLMMDDEDSDLGKLCEGGSAVIKADTVSCVQEKTAPLSEALAGRLFADEGADSQMHIRVEKAGDGVVRVLVDIAALLAEAGQEAGNEGDRSLAALMVAGHGITFRIAGEKIIESNGRIAQDGRSASFTLPLSALVDPAARKSLPETFTTTVRYRPPCRLWIFC
ncbi:MAG: hypothetical protein D6740_06505 [Alphaproteobacteria bacterium]|nr:MAG: hypothetical protein D6740_06505 [Alphaproteobacteria bacterium]